jgi:hypothetical protein
MNLLSRLWTGIVAAVTAVAVAVVVDIIGSMLLGLPIELLPWILLVFGTIGFLIGIVVGSGRRSRTKMSCDKSAQRDVGLE